MKLAREVVLWGACAGLCVPAGAVDDPSRLGKDLTPLGVERAASKDGAIPEWAGATNTPAAGWSYGKVRGDFWRHKGEKPLFTIDASNVEKYGDKLSPGQVALLKSLPGYKMNVFASKRECSYPE